MRLERIMTVITIICIFGLITYSLVGTSGNIELIKSKAPEDMEKRNWRILRYEGYSFDSWGDHGGGVWYHVANVDNPDVQYRVYVTMWNDELQYHYGGPEKYQIIHIHYNESPE